MPRGQGRLAEIPLLPRFSGLLLLFFLFFGVFLCFLLVLAPLANLLCDRYFSE